MKKAIISLVLIPFLSTAQQKLPTYPEVLTEFIQHYSYTPEEIIDGMNFAKKKDGWHVQVIDRVTEKVKSDQVYWPVEKGAFQPLQNFKDPVTSTEAQHFLSEFLGSNATYNFYGYERCLYYGYNRWAEDLITEYGKKDNSNYSDLLLESLGRAYSAYASKFLWYQFGGNGTTTDTLKFRLKPLQIPSQKRIDSVTYYLDRSIEMFKLLAAKNPAYPTVVGNSGMKAFNEQINAYMQLSLAGQDELAKRQLKKITPNSSITQLARNYLSASQPNSILFTFGDNDTFPLWYVQETEGYRKDVAVINTNMLGLPIYIQMLKRNKVVNFSTGAHVYGDSTFIYSVYQEDSSNSTSATLTEFIHAIQTRKYKSESEYYGALASYPFKHLTLAIDLERFKSIVKQPNFKTPVEIKLSDYLLSDAFMILDIIKSNLYIRPIYFASQYPQLLPYMQRTGLLYQFLPLDSTQAELTKEISAQKTKDYLMNSFLPAASNDISSGISPSPSNDEGIYSLYAFTAGYYLENKQLAIARELIDKLLEDYKNNLPRTYNQYVIGTLMLDVGLREQGIKLMEEYAEFMYNQYNKPSAIFPYLSRETALHTIQYVNSILLERNIQSEKLDALIYSLEER